MIRQDNQYVIYEMVPKLKIVSFVEPLMPHVSAEFL